MTNSKKFDLVLFSIGPIQQFITTARRTSDLKAGSQILSEIMKEILVYAEQNRMDVIFPRKLNNRWQNGLPNRTTIKVEVGQGKIVATQLVEVLQKRRDRLAKDVKNYLHNMTNRVPINWNTRWDEQIKHWIEYYWVVEPWDGDPNSYRATYQKLNLHHDTRKFLRYYPNISHEGEKCSLCGIRSALAPVNDDFWKDISKRVGYSYLRSGERLCAVCSIKRFIPKTGDSVFDFDRFPSISSIASSSYRVTILQNWNNKKLQNSIKELLEIFNNLSLPKFKKEQQSLFWAELSNKLPGNSGINEFLLYDGDFFYPEFYELENVAEVLNKPINDLRNDTNLIEYLSQAKKKLSEISRILEDIGSPISIPHTYYGILKMDGDRMGYILDTCSENEHVQVSEALSKSAKEITLYMNQKSAGVLVYSGGDDALVLLPVNEFLHIADELRKIYSKNMRLNYQTITPYNKNPSASIGISLVHHTAPLQSALEIVYEAEHLAKEKYDRNAICIHMIKRSGADRVFGAHWFDNQSNKNPIEELVMRIATNQLSGKFAYDLLDEKDGLSNVPLIYKEEFTRLIKRHANKEIWNSVADFKDLGDRLDQYSRQIQYSNRLDDLINWIILARFLALGDN